MNFKKLTWALKMILDQPLLILSSHKLSIKLAGMPIKQAPRQMQLEIEEQVIVEMKKLIKIEFIREKKIRQFEYYCCFSVEKTCKFMSALTFGIFTKHAQKIIFHYQI